MKSVVWVIDPARGREAAEGVLSGLREKGLAADLHQLGSDHAIVIADPPGELETPEEVLRTSSFAVPLTGSVKRRTLIDRFATLLALSVGGAALGVSGLFAFPPEKRRGEAIEELEVATLDELERKGFKTFRFGNEPGIVVLSAGKLHALSLVCTHLGCLVTWNAERKQLVCPCHRAAFDLGGNVLEGPPPRPLASFHVSTQDNRVLVRRPGRVG